LTNGIADFVLAERDIELEPPGRLGMMLASEDAGVKIREVRPASPADKAGFLPGHRIRSIAREPVRNMQDVRLALLFFDGGCPLCSREVAHYRVLDRRNRIRWVDIGREPEALVEHGIDRSAAMQRLHAVDETGGVVTGMAAFVAVWRKLPG
jgi:hypothetical protein